MQLRVALVKQDSYDIFPKKIKLVSSHVPFDHFIIGVNIYNTIGTISQIHFQEPRMFDATMLTTKNIAISYIFICLPSLQLLPIASPAIKLGTRLNAVCILNSTLVVDISSMGKLLNIIRTIIIPIAIIHLYFPTRTLYKKGAIRYRRSINETNHAPRRNIQYSRVLIQRIQSYTEYKPKSKNIKQNGMKASRYEIQIL